MSDKDKPHCMLQTNDGIRSATYHPNRDAAFRDIVDTVVSDSSWLSGDREHARLVALADNDDYVAEELYDRFIQLYMEGVDFWMEVLPLLNADAVDKPKRETHYVMVAGHNSTGAGDIFFIKVVCSQDAYDKGEHYDAAFAEAREHGYAPLLGLDEGDPAGAAIMDVFEWDTATKITLK